MLAKVTRFLTAVTIILQSIVSLFNWKLNAPKQA